MSHLSLSQSPIDRDGGPGPESALHPRAASSAHDHGGGTGWRAAAAVTLHCLTGCLIGEWIGLAMGVAFALPRGVTAVLATVLAYTSGFGLTIWPLLRRGMRLWAALTTVFVGEAVSIGVMEVAMNAVDFAMGGMSVKSLFVARYWEALAVASVAGFLGAWPVNFWLLGRNMKSCHHRASDASGENQRGAKSCHRDQHAAQRRDDAGAMAESPHRKGNQAATGEYQGNGRIGSELAECRAEFRSQRSGESQIPGPAGHL